MPDHFHAISGASGGGKSTLIEALSVRGYRVVREPGRLLVREELARGGSALPWLDHGAFMERLFERYIAGYDAAVAVDDGSPVFFDRGLPEVLGWARRHGPGPQSRFTAAAARCRYAPTVWITPPWRAIYVSDDERRKPFEQAVAEQATGDSGWLEAGYTLRELPRLPVAGRADWLLGALGLPPSAAQLLAKQ